MLKLSRCKEISDVGYTSQKGFFFYIDSTRRFARMFICIFFHVTWCLINKDKLLARLQTVILITYHYGMNTVAAPHNTLLLCVFNTWACIANKNGDLIAFRSFSHIYFLVEKDFFCCCKTFYDDRLFIDPYFTFTVNWQQE